MCGPDFWTCVLIFVAELILWCWNFANFQTFTPNWSHIWAKLLELKPAMFSATKCYFGVKNVVFNWKLESSRELDYLSTGGLVVLWTDSFLNWGSLWRQHTERGILWKLHVSHFITMIMVNVSHVLLLISLLCTIRLMPTFKRQNPSLLEDLFQEIINMTNKMTNINYYHAACFHRKLLHGITRVRIHNSGKPSCGNTSDTDYW